ncbi:MAG: inorganic phosphate transporter [Bacteroidetes bacterium]|nr:MAG: inorganic phosphate transporter [Bacteroidota bacterium]
MELYVIFIIIVALAFDFLNGMNDAANSIATIVSTRVLSPKMAVLWAAFFNFVAAFGFGVAVATTIGKGIIDPKIVTPDLIFGSLVGAIVWTHLCTHYGYPISVSHALIGGLAGAGLYKGGFDVLNMGGIERVLLFIFLSPTIGMIMAFFLMIAVYWIFKDWNSRQVDKVFRVGQLVSSAAYSLGHGTNDAQKTMGIITILLYSTGYFQGGEMYVPWWVIISAHTAIGLGTLMGGWKVVGTLGVKLTHLKPVHGFCAEGAGSLVLLGTAMFGIPVSTTHTIAGAIMGVGATRRLSAVRWGIVGKIVMAWVFTIPTSAAIGALSYWLIDLF